MLTAALGYYAKKRQTELKGKAKYLWLHISARLRNEGNPKSLYRVRCRWAIGV